MRRWLFLLAFTGACGKVTSATDAPIDVPPGTLLEGCVLMLHMDEPQWTGAAGEVLDDCGGDNRGTLSGSASTVAGGVRGRAGSFAGTACIQVADAPELRASAALTMSAWVLPTALDGDLAFGVISKRIDMANMSAYNLYLWQRNHAWVDLEGMDNRFEGKATLTNQTWAQITVVFDGGLSPAQRARIYVNGSF